MKKEFDLAEFGPMLTEYHMSERGRRDLVKILDYFELTPKSRFTEEEAVTADITLHGMFTILCFHNSLHYKKWKQTAEWVESMISSMLEIVFNSLCVKEGA